MSYTTPLLQFRALVKSLTPSISMLGARCYTDKKGVNHTLSSLAVKLQEVAKQDDSTGQGHGCDAKKLVQRIRQLEKEADKNSSWLPWLAARVRDVVGGLLFGSHEAILQKIESDHASHKLTESVEDRLIKNAARTLEQQLDREMPSGSWGKFRWQEATDKNQQKYTDPADIKLESESVDSSHGAINASTTSGQKELNQDRYLSESMELKLDGQTHSATLIGVFDGHGTGGEIAADHIRARLKDALLGQFNAGKDIWHALRQACVKLDESYSGKGGSCATIGLIVNGQVWLANVGDSRAILVRREDIVQMTQDQLPTEPNFMHRITDLGGTVDKKGKTYRVGRKLNVARSIGDHDTKGMSPVPKITRFDLEKGDKLLFASDGLWGVGSTAQVGKDLSEGMTADRLVKKALEAASGDNVTVLTLDYSA